MNFRFILNGFWHLFIKKFGWISKEKQKLYQERYDICKKCIYREDKFCGLCGCFIKAKTKVDFELDKDNKSIDGCPKRYW